MKKSTTLRFFLLLRHSRDRTKRALPTWRMNCSFHGKVLRVFNERFSQFSRWFNLVAASAQIAVCEKDSRACAELAFVAQISVFFQDTLSLQLQFLPLNRMTINSHEKNHRVFASGIAYNAFKPTCQFPDLNDWCHVVDDDKRFFVSKVGRKLPF